jgi:hypothetical protein
VKCPNPECGGTGRYDGVGPTVIYQGKRYASDIERCPECNGWWTMTYSDEPLWEQHGRRGYSGEVNPREV